MGSRRTAALLWGVVGALSFLVLHQAYLLLDGTFLGVGPIAGVTLAVFAAAAAAAYLAEGRMGRSPNEGDGSVVEPDDEVE